MAVYDVTMPIHAEMAVYKNKEEFKPSIEKVRTIEQGSNESRITLYSHAGTHVDAPYHMSESGYRLDDIPLNKLYGKCKVWDLSHIEDCIERQDIEAKPVEKNDFIFIKTKNSFEDQFNYQFVYLSAEAAQYLADKGIAVVGIDAFSIERNHPEHPTHHILMENDVLIVEGLRLKEISEGEYMAVIAPLLIAGGDGAPARVLLIRD